MGMPETLGVEGEVELKCGNHVARLLGKLPPELQVDFRRHQFFSLIQCTHNLNSLSGSSTRHGVRVILNFSIKEIPRAE